MILLITNTDTAYTERYMGFSSGDENYRGYDVRVA